MTKFVLHRGPRRWTWASTLLSVAVISLAAGSHCASAADDEFAYGRRLYNEKAQCAFCHGWAGDGNGDPRHPGVAANLRETMLDNDQLAEVIQCGRPGTAMPHFDSFAYTDKRCYGMTATDLGAAVPTDPLGDPLQRREIQVVVEYILAKFKGKGSITAAECVETLGAADRECDQYKDKR